MLRGPLPAAIFDRLLARCPNLRWVHSATAGVERVLTPQAAERGLVITNARGVFSEPIAEYVLMMILAVIRRLPQLLELQRERTWQPLEATEMREMTVGIVGLGSIGRQVAKLALGVRQPGRGVARRDADRRGRGGSGAARRRRGAAADQLPAAPGAERLRGPGAAADAGHGGSLRRGHAGADEARLVADQRGARPPRRRAGAGAGAARRADGRRGAGRVPRRAAAARVAALRRRRTSSSRRTPRGRAGGCWIAASSCSATTCAGSRPGSRCSTSSTRARATERRCRSRSSGLPAPARPPSSTRSRAATPRPAASAA